jgi:hypothetical protein
VLSIVILSIDIIRYFRSRKNGMFRAYCCAHCRHRLRVRECHAGKTLRCPSCAAAIVIAAAQAEQGVAAPASASARGGNARSILSRAVLPWLLLAPAVLAVALLVWAGPAVLSAGLGAGLGGMCLLLGQRGRWPMSLRIHAALSLALLGHGLTLAGPLLSVPKRPLSSLPDVPSLSQTISVDNPTPAGSSEVDGVRRLQLSLPTPPPRADLLLVAHLGTLLAAAVAARPDDGGSAFITTADGRIKEFSYPDFRPRAVYRLEQIAYRAVLDGRRGVLWTAASPPSELRVNRHGDRPRGSGDLHAYDIRRAAQERNASESFLQPRRVLPLKGEVLELLMSLDESVLFYLARTDTGVRLGRIDAARQCLDREVALPREVRALSLTPNGRTLVAAGGGGVYVLEAATLSQRRHFAVEADIYAVAAGNDGRVYLAEQGQWTRLTRLDLGGEEPIVRQWTARMHGRIYLKMSVDQYRLYVGTSSVISDHLDALLIRGHRWNTPPLTAMAISDEQAPIQGEFFLTPDGRFLINRWGKVYRLTNGRARLPGFDASRATRDLQPSRASAPG